MGESRKVAFKTLGCKVNQYDSGALKNLFKREGFPIVSFDDKADIYVINTCIVTTMAAQKSRKLIRQARKFNPKALVVVAGCYPQAQKEEALKIKEADLFIGTKDRRHLLDYIQKGPGDFVTSFGEYEPFEELGEAYYPHHSRAFIKIQEGCVQGCTYCIIPRARGPLRSRSYDSIIKEAASLLCKNFQELVLTGIHLGAYGEGGKTSLTQVIKGILNLGDKFRLRLSSLEVTEVNEELITLLSQDNGLCPHLHLPLQSGSPRILKEMGRPYTPLQFLEKTATLLEKIPDLSITTDMLVGFPGEGSSDFLASCQMAQRVGFSQIHVFPYSRRPYTPAFLMGDQIPELVKKERLQALQSISKELAQKFQKKYLHKVQEVLLEEGQDGIYSGFTSNYLRVFCLGEDGIEGSFQSVDLERLTEEGIWGTIREKDEC